MAAARPEIATSPTGRARQARRGEPEYSCRHSTCRRSRRTHRTGAVNIRSFVRLGSGRTRRAGMRYTVILEQEPDGGYVVSVPALPGCVSQGNTRSEALANIREAIEIYVEDCRVAGDPVPIEAGIEFVEVEAA